MKPRNLKCVIEDILVVVPYTEDELISSLKHFIKGLPYCPPEIMGHQWVKAHNILFNYKIDLLDEEWKRTVVDIWINSERLTTNNID